MGRLSTALPGDSALINRMVSAILGLAPKQLKFFHAIKNHEHPQKGAARLPANDLPGFLRSPDNPRSGLPLKAGN